MTSEVSIHYETAHFQEVTSICGEPIWKASSMKTSHKTEVILLFSSLARIQGEDTQPRETHIFEDTNCAVNPESWTQIYSLMRGKKGSIREKWWGTEKNGDEFHMSA